MTSHVRQAFFQIVPLALRRRIQFMKAHRRWPNLRCPSSFNEKVNWRILQDRREVLSWTCDKLQMKEYARQADPRVKVPATLWAGSDIAGLASVQFPERWILKANHRSQCVYPGHGAPDWEDLERATADWMDSWQAEQLGEWAYSRAERLMFLEEWIGEGSAAPSDYKFFVFHGKVEIIQLDEDRFSQHRLRLYDKQWNPISASKDLWTDATLTAPPANLEEMVSIAETLGQPFDFMRIDLFNTQNGVYFGETTPYPGGGLSPFNPPSFDYELGQKWMLPGR